MAENYNREIRKRARRIRKVNKPKATIKEYMQYSLVILIIAAILLGALYMTGTL